MKINIAKGIKINKSSFDVDGQIDFKVPKDCDLIILCGNSGGGYRPYQCLLPHQVYVKDIKKTFEEKHFEVIYALPVKSCESILLVGRDDYLSRWENKENK